MDISDDEVFRAIATNRFQSEFNGQINSVFGEEPGKVELQIKDASTVFSVAGDEVAEVHDRRVLRFRAHYLDDPFLIDSLGGPYGPAFSVQAPPWTPGGAAARFDSGDHP